MPKPPRTDDIIQEGRNSLGEAFTEGLKTRPKEFKDPIFTDPSEMHGDNYTEKQETVSSRESDTILALTNRIKALEEFLDPLSYEDPRKLFGGTD
ncbi:hypothetical protein [Argonema galeatum]|uniref:hypothetical protein n=1 Tax=Argonema galeatum TaxID=2942762 RepID=UPI0020134358|nr:hypothetical protein [Argonema galeatum]MCL1468607.1 hypothetical protein [Argonema galeatum A003/A1]